MSQYIAPGANLSDRDVLLLIDQKLFTLIDQLYGNGKPGEIDVIHERITAMKTEQATMRSWQDKRSGSASVVRLWLIPIIAIVISVWAAWSKK